MPGEGQGNIIYGSTTASAGGGGGVTIEAANNGLSLKADGPGFDVVLGNDFGDVTNPAKLLNVRAIPMDDFAIRFLLDQPDPAFIGLNDGEAPLFFDYLDSALIGTRWIWFWPSNYGTDYAPHGEAGEFGIGYDTFPGVNEPTTPRPNVVALFWAYNTEYSSGRINTNEAAFRYATETFFVIGPDDFFEFHTPEMTTQTGMIVRLDSTYASRTTALTFREIVTDDISIYSVLFPPSTGQFLFDMQYNSVADNTKLSINSENAGGVSELEFGNWTDGIGNAFITVQSGLMDIVALVDIDLRSPRVIMDSSNYGNIVNPTVSSATNTDSPIGDEMLGVQSTVKGFRPPSMTAVQRLALAAIGGQSGLVVNDITVNKLYYWNGTTWEQVQSL